MVSVMGSELYFTLPHLFSDVSQCPCQHPIGTGLASKGLAHNHEAVPHNHHLIDLQDLALKDFCALQVHLGTVFLWRDRKEGETEGSKEGGRENGREQGREGEREGGIPCSFCLTTVHSCTPLLTMVAIGKPGSMCTYYSLLLVLLQQIRTLIAGARVE